MNRNQIIVIGAGIAGATCARALRDADLDVLVLERARGAGGRCATKRVAEQRIDHGVAFAHGSDARFLSAVREAGDPLADWPRTVLGSGSPCNPRAFSVSETRIAIREGMNRLPKHLLHEVPTHFRHDVVGIAPVPGGFAVSAETPDGPARFEADHVVVAMATQQVARLLGTFVDDRPVMGAARRLCGMLHTVPCLTLLVGFERSVAADLPWDMRYPEHPAIQLISHDSTKRRDPEQTALVIQARARWSASHIKDSPEEWGDALLRAAREVDPKIPPEPLWRHSHRWSFARVDSVATIAAPMSIPGPLGGTLALIGEAFAPEGGLEGAWRAARRLADGLIAAIASR